MTLFETPYAAIFIPVLMQKGSEFPGGAMALLFPAQFSLCQRDCVITGSLSGLSSRELMELLHTRHLVVGLEV